MRVGSTRGRLCLALGDEVIDVERASAGRFSSDPQAVYDRWADFRSWAETLTAGDLSSDARIGAAADLVLDAPVPRPPQVFAIGLNYADHAAEGGLATGERPMVFTKFASSITGPTGDIALPPGAVDYEAELVVVIGERGHKLTADVAWDYVAGLTIGQDLSERQLQTSSPAPPQFSMGKSFPQFAPIGPWVVTVDDVADPNDLAIGCTLNGDMMQQARTSQMIFSVSDILCYLSSVVTLLPGDIVFTGTPAGVGFVRDPQRLIQPDDELITTIESLGALHHRFVAPEGSRQARAHPSA